LPVLGLAACADEPGFAVGDSAACGVWLGAGVDEDVEPGRCVAKRTPATRTTPTIA